MSHNHGPCWSHECSERRGAGEGGTCHMADGRKRLRQRAPTGDYSAGTGARNTARSDGWNATHGCAGAAAGGLTCARLTERLR